MVLIRLMVVTGRLVPLGVLHHTDRTGWWSMVEHESMELTKLNCVTGTVIGFAVGHGMVMNGVLNGVCNVQYMYRYGGFSK